ncbi:cupin domain-containing protein [Pengzhenrongella sicca]|uniref:Cupin domain-containing protein n=1 Tax=Pengzhenrongella sicca TaxID=2819238 RepID=A0A8A4ZAP5_9MICO|nr:cupin domain-containing protein [Pengzhenrongella sicca]QTE28944.1 cupin domain-containing protein [Pengzhenrongella sicca]
MSPDLSDRASTGLRRTVSSPDMGVTVTFVVAFDESADGSVESRVQIPAREPGPPRHYHLDFDETFTALEGELTMDLGSRRGLVLRPGESVRVPRGVPHRYYNSSDRLAVFGFRADPGQAYELGIRAGFGLANDGRTTSRGLPKDPLQMALLFAAAGSWVTGIPHGMQSRLTAAGVRLARRLGYDPHFSRYAQGDGQ